MKDKCILEYTKGVKRQDARDILTNTLALAWVDTAKIKEAASNIDDTRRNQAERDCGYLRFATAMASLLKEQPESEAQQKILNDLDVMMESLYEPYI